MKKAVVGMFVIALLLIAAVSATGIFAYFTAQADSTSTFKSGNLKIDLSDVDQTGVEHLTATWNTPENWAPGQTQTGSLTINNTGNIDANVVWGALDITDDTMLADVILVTVLRDSTMGSTDNDAPSIAANWGNKDGKLTLTEMANFGGTGNDVFWSNGNGGVFIPAGTSATIYMTFQFDPAAGNAYMSKTATMTLTLTAEQVHY